MTTTDRLRELGRRAREQYSSPIHNCQPISEKLANLCHRNDIPAEVHERALGEKRITHFIVMVPAKELVDVEGENRTVYVDATIDQFTLENWQDGTVKVGLGRSSDLPEIGIYPPDCEAREVWYHRR